MSSQLKIHSCKYLTVAQYSCRNCLAVCSNLIDKDLQQALLQNVHVSVREHFEGLPLAVFSYQLFAVIRSPCSRHFVEVGLTHDRAVYLPLERAVEGILGKDHFLYL